MKRPIICFPAIDWNYLFHRPQQLMTRLAQAGHPVYVRNITQIPGSSPEEIIPNLWVYRDFDKLPPEIARQAIYFIYFPAHAGWIDPSPQKFIIYDCIDDDPIFEAHEDMALHRANLVLGVSERIMEKFMGRHHDLLLLSNGVDVEHYQSKKGAIPSEMKVNKIPGVSIIGFSGAFYQGWVDIELMYQIAQSNPKWRVVIIGESYQWDFTNAPINLVYLGCKTYQALPSYIRHFDVGLIPFLDNQIARGANPVKLYEYFAAGIPVVSKDLPFIKDLKPPLVYNYHQPHNCISAIKQALTDNQTYPAMYEKLRLDFASQNSWDIKINLLLHELKKRTWLES